MGHQGGFKLKTCILFRHWCRTIKKKYPALCNKLGKRKAFAKCCHCKKKNVSACGVLWLMKCSSSLIPLENLENGERIKFREKPYADPDGHHLTEGEHLR